MEKTLTMKKYAMFISGNGGFAKVVHKNMNLVNNAELSLIISDRDCNGFHFFNNETEIPSILFNYNDYSSKEAFEKDILKSLNEHNIDFSFLTYDRLLGKTLLGDSNKNIFFNLHLSLLPAFSGLGAIKKAYNSGVLQYGATVHFVDDSIDGGPILSQTIIGRDINDTIEEFTQKLYEQASVLLIDSINRVVNYEYSIEGNKVIFNQAIYSGTDYNPQLTILKNMVIF